MSTTNEHRQASQLGPPVCNTLATSWYFHPTLYHREPDCAPSAKAVRRNAVLDAWNACQAEGMAGNALPPLPLDLQHDYQGKCWWCGQPADSKEHRYKKTDVVKAFGAGPWVEKPLRFANGSARGQEIQGPKSDRLKFAAVLCSPCNTARSQDFDHAYRTFSDFADAHADAFAARAIVDFGKVYGSDRRHQQQLLAKYFVKHIGCRMAEDKIKVPQAVKDYLDGNRKRLPHLSIRLGANLDIYAMERHCETVHSIPPGSLWSGDHTCTYSKSQRRLTPHGVTSATGGSGPSTRATSAGRTDGRTSSGAAAGWRLSTVRHSLNRWRRTASSAIQIGSCSSDARRGLETRTLHGSPRSHTTEQRTASPAPGSCPNRGAMSTDTSSMATQLMGRTAEASQRAVSTGSAPAIRARQARSGER